MEEILDIYKLPYDPNRPVVCLDESSKQLIKDVKAPLPTIPGSVEKYDTEYERNGTANIFIAYEPLSGFRLTDLTERRTKKEWSEFVQMLVDHENYKDVEKIVLIMDNLNIHHKSSLYEIFEPKMAKRIADKLEIHYTPKHGSWLNMAEIELSHLGRQCMDRRIGDREILSKEVAAWTEARNTKKCGANWQFTTADARVKLRRLYPSIES
jgi:transposase